MRNNSFDQAFSRRARVRPRHGTPQRRASRAPSASIYILAAGATAASLFFTLWWMLHSGGDEAPWVPAGLAASVVMLVAIAAREVVLQRTRTRHLLDGREQPRGRPEHRRSGASAGVHRVSQGDTYKAALRALQKQCAQADAPGALPDAHMDAYLSCQEYLENADETLRTQAVGGEARAALRAGQERARALARHHLLDWARGATRSLTAEAQRRVRMSDKIEAANRALEVIDSALRLYPEEAQLRESETAVREYITSVKVSHWVELAERAAFKGYYRRAIDRYRDALFYLSRESMGEEARADMAQRIEREIDLLRARLKTRTMSPDQTQKEN